jgi:hypothetical protein
LLVQRVLAGLVERSSKPHHRPRRTPALVEAQILALRRDRRLGPAPHRVHDLPGHDT